MNSYVKRLNDNIMKKISLLFVFFAFCNNAMSQFRPLFEEGKSWVVDYYTWDERVEATYTYIVKGDSIVDSINYKKVYFTSKENLENLSLYYLARDENGVAYFRKDGKEHILFDFNRNIGDEFNVETELRFPEYNFKGIVREISNTESNDGVVRRTFNVDLDVYYNSDGEDEYECRFPYTFIEGIGEASYGIEIDYCIGCTGNYNNKLRCVHNADGVHIYGNAEGCINTGIEIVDDDKDSPHTIYSIEGQVLDIYPNNKVYIQNGKKFLKRK